MLVLTRKLGEAIIIGEDVKITVVQVKGKQVRVGIEAPKETKIHREELLKEKNSEAETEAEDEKKTGTND